MPKKNFTEAGMNVTNKFFSAPTEEKPEKKPVRVFSFRAEIDDAIRWRLFASCLNMKIEDFCSQAINEYMKSNPLDKLEAEWLEKKFIEQKQKENA